jgi:hypothetical protein
MSTLIVVGYDDSYKAAGVRSKLRKPPSEYLLGLLALRKGISTFLITLASLALVAGLTGCATSKEKQAAQQKENMLVAAGFKVITATTPSQQQMLKTLPAGRISAVRRYGQVYFVYPVHAQNLLYVGQNSQYLAYQQAAQVTTEDTLVKQEIESINRSMSSPGWEAPWGDWDAQ